MSFRRTWAIVLRYLYASRDPSRIGEFLIWPMIDMGFLGLMATWIGAISSNAHILTYFISALILWEIIYRAHFELCYNILDEFWEQNLINFIASPLRPMEWVLAAMISGALKIIFTLFFGAFVGWLFFHVNIFSLGWILPIFVVLCLLSGWIVGFFGAALIIYKGSKYPQIPWVLITLLALFSAIYYPVSILPHWMQGISQALPMTYIFAGLRDWVTTGTLTEIYFVYSLVLSLFYLILGIAFFYYMFEKSRVRGFSRLY